MIQIKRAYEPATPADGARFLVDRLWPRGVTKQALELEGWLKDLAPSDKLRRWFKHDPAKWDEFQHRYFAELDEKPKAVQGLAEAARHRSVTLIFGARDTEHNHAVALKAYLLRRPRGRSRR